MHRYLTASTYIDVDTPDVRAADAHFAPSVEQLAFAVRTRAERMLPEIWAEPLPVVVHALECYDTWDRVLANLPDVDLLD